MADNIAHQGTEPMTISLNGESGYTDISFGDATVSFTAMQLAGLAQLASQYVGPQSGAEFLRVGTLDMTPQPAQTATSEENAPVTSGPSLVASAPVSEPTASTEGGGANG